MEPVAGKPMTDERTEAAAGRGWGKVGGVLRPTRGVRREQQVGERRHGREETRHGDAIWGEGNERARKDGGGRSCRKHDGSDREAAKP